MAACLAQHTWLEIADGHVWCPTDIMLSCYWAAVHACVLAALG